MEVGVVFGGDVDGSGVCGEGSSGGCEPFDGGEDGDREGLRV